MRITGHTKQEPIQPQVGTGLNNLYMFEATRTHTDSSTPSVPRSSEIVTHLVLNKKHNSMSREHMPTLQRAVQFTSDLRLAAKPTVQTCVALL